MIMITDLVSVKEGQAIATGPELSYALITGPVLVAADQVREEALVLVRTGKVVILLILLILLLLTKNSYCRHQHQR